MSGPATRTIRRQLIEALEKRADRHEGEARQRLDQRLAELRGTEANEVAAPAADVVAANAAPVAAAPVAGPLRELVERIAGSALARGAVAAAQLPPQPELAALGEFRKLWSDIQAESRLQQSLQMAPASAGPLNSAGLVHRSIALMLELSPGYLQHFLSYVDELAWLEPIAGSTSAGSYAPRATSPDKRARRKPRA